MFPNTSNHALPLKYTDFFYHSNIPRMGHKKIACDFEIVKWLLFDHQVTSFPSIDFLHSSYPCGSPTFLVESCILHRDLTPRSSSTLNLSIIVLYGGSCFNKKLLLSFKDSSNEICCCCEVIVYMNSILLNSNLGPSVLISDLNWIPGLDLGHSFILNLSPALHWIFFGLYCTLMWTLF